MYVLIFSTNIVWNISHSKKKWARFGKKCILMFKQSTGYCCQIVMWLPFSNRLWNNTQLSNFMKIQPEGAELFHADGRTGMTQQTFAFRNFANALKSCTDKRRSRKSVSDWIRNCYQRTYTNNSLISSGSLLLVVVWRLNFRKGNVNEFLTNCLTPRNNFPLKGCWLLRW